MKIIETLRARRARIAYRAAMLRAIDAACERSEIWGYASRTDGLRAIRALERLNGRRFDPLNPVLVSVVRGQAAKQHQMRFRRSS